MAALRKIDFLSFLFCASLISTGVVFKIYPAIFLMFILSYLCFYRIHSKLFWPVLVFLISAAFFTLLNLGKSFDAVSFIKLIVNISFFVCAASFVYKNDVERSLNNLYISAFIYLCLSFVQTLYSVYTLGLWSLPLSISSSSDSYIISSGTALFGDESKNIFASNVVVFFMAAIVFGYYKKFSLLIWLSVFFGLFCLIYISSRTAQLAFLVFLVALGFHHIYNKKKGFVLAIVFFLFVPLILYLVQSVIRLDYSTLTDFDSAEIGGHRGDGLLARFIIWGYVFTNLKLDDFIFGNGILSFSYYTNGLFVENNPHNVFLSIFLDFGVLTLIAYGYLLKKIFISNGVINILVFPFLVFANSQYLGYDSGLVMLWLIAICWNKLLTKKAYLNDGCAGVLAIPKNYSVLRN